MAAASSWVWMFSSALVLSVWPLLIDVNPLEGSCVTKTELAC